MCEVGGQVSVERAGALHRQAAAVAAVAGPLLDGAPTSHAYQRRQHDLAARSRAAAATLTPGWLGAPLDAAPATGPLGDSPSPLFVRVGQAHPLDDASFPVVLPLLGTGHLAVDADARDPRVAALLRSLVLRLLAACPAGSLRVLAVDGAATFAPFGGIGPAMPPTVADLEGLRAVLGEAEARVREPRRDGPFLLVVVGSLPELTEPADLVRLAALASVGPAARVHLVVAGWPPPPLTPESTQAPLAACTQITVRNPYTWVGDPPGAHFGATPRLGGRLAAPTYLDADPPVDLIRRVCARLAAAACDLPVPGTRGTPVPGAGARLAPGAGATPAPGAGDPAWQEYLAAAQQLDAVRQAPVDRALDAAEEALATLGSRLADQRARLARAGAPVAPGPADLHAARQAMGSPEAVRAALASARRAVDAADAALRATERGPAPQGLRDALIYGGYAALAVLTEIAVFLTVAVAADWPALAAAGVLVPPPVGYGMGWLTVRALAEPGRAAGTAVWGALICGLALPPALALAALAAIR
jgi:hypothetical protein